MFFTVLDLELFKVGVVLFLLVLHIIHSRIKLIKPVRLLQSCFSSNLSL